MTTLYRWMADIMSGCYAATHNYALAIALLTLATVAITTPLTWKASRGMIAMQALQPEMKKLQTKYKGDREAMNREMQKLYQEAGINPLAGCLPLLPQMVVFYILYHTIANLSHRLAFTTRALAQQHCPVPANGAAHITLTTGKYTCSDPTNLGTHSLLYHNLLNAGGHMNVFGFDLTLGVRTAHGGALVGCLILVALVVGAQYWQTRQVNRRNPASAANQQAQMMQRIFPVFFGLISINIQAGVNVYFFVSALCRIAQQSLMFRYDPVLRRQLQVARGGKPVDLPPRSAKAGGGLFGALLGGPAQGGQGGGNQPPGGGSGGGGAGQDGGNPSPRAGGGLARLLGLADPDPATPTGQRGNLGRFLDGGSGGSAPRSGGSLKDRGGAPAGGGGSNTAAKGPNTNGSSSGNGAGSYNSRNRRGAAPPAKHQDRNRSRSKKSRRSR